jgi:hypothetical protein
MSDLEEFIKNADPGFIKDFVNNQLIKGKINKSEADQILFLIKEIPNPVVRQKPPLKIVKNKHKIILFSKNSKQ